MDQNSMNKIKLYTMPACNYCKVVMDELKENNIEFEEINIVDIPKEWAIVTDFTGMGATPTIYFKDEYFVAGRDFPSAPYLVRIIHNYVPSTKSVSDQVLQKLKTTNFNIGVALKQMNTKLHQISDQLNTISDADKE